MQNRDVLVRNPDIAIPNAGVAKVGRPKSPQEWEVLRFELESFVCKGEYANGLDRILRSYLTNIDRASQPAVWISGFYGSGKSHFARVLEALWANVAFPDSARARGIVHGIPADITDQLRELDRRGAQGKGGIWSASGKFSQGLASIRLGLLDLLFEAAGLPTGYGPGRFVLWLRQDGHEAAVRAALQAKGRTLEQELPHMYVSPPLGAALAETVPGFAHDGPSASAALRTQFGPVTDIDENQLFTAMEQALRLVSANGHDLPLTLIALDEVQQFIGDDGSRAMDVQNIVEACTGRFGSRILFLATGQSALQGTAQLQKLQGRFTVKVQLSENDVHEVIQRVVLEKQQQATAGLERVLDTVAPEIDRQLAGTKIGPTTADHKDLLADYPLLPARRRFMEAVLRAVDKGGGMAGQLRSQLQVVQEATRRIADQPVGWVIPADAVFDIKREELISTGALLPDKRQAIDNAREPGTPEAILRARLLALVFLVSELPATGLDVTGVRATGPVLADLLVEDLTAGSAALRERVAAALAAMEQEGLLLAIDGVYHLQTRESQEWDAAFRNHFNARKNDPAGIAAERSDALRKGFAERFKLTHTQGASTVRRSGAAHWGTEHPALADGQIPVWVRDEWAVSESSVRNDAQVAGPTSPTIFVFLPRVESERLREAIASARAARETLDSRPMPATDEGRQARSAMAARAEEAQRHLTLLVGNVLDKARVYQGGGEEIAGITSHDALRTAIEHAAVRMYPRFGMGDQAKWGAVAEQARKGAGNPMQALGWNQEPQEHEVCKELLARLAQTTTGSKLRAIFTAPPYGWSQDTIDGALLALVAHNRVRAGFNGKPRAIGELIPTQIGQTDFVTEHLVITLQQRLDLQGLLKDTLGPTSKDDLGPAFVRLVDRLVQLDAQAHGEAPLPAPVRPALLDDLRARSGVAQLLAGHADRDQLRAWYLAWSELAGKRDGRFARWQELGALLRHGATLPALADVVAARDAIVANRSLLAEPDPLPSLLAAAANALREALTTYAAAYTDARQREIDKLAATPEWGKLTDGVWNGLLRDKDLSALPALELGTTRELLAELDRHPLSTWPTRIAAVTVQAGQVHEAAVNLIKPGAVKVPLGNHTINDAAELEAWIAAIRARIHAELASGRTVIVQGS
jgi:hypothetical protein